MEISDDARIWIYQSDRILSAQEVQDIQDILNAFTSQWQAHGHALAAKAEVLHNQFIVLSVDEHVAGATGCSIDKSVHLMKDIETQFGINLFDRFRIAFREGEDIKNCSRQEFEQLIAEGKVNQDTVVFNNMVAIRRDLKSSWELPLRDSWHARVFRVDGILSQG